MTRSPNAITLRTEQPSRVNQNLTRAIQALGAAGYDPQSAIHRAKSLWPQDYREVVQTIEKGAVVPTNTTTGIPFAQTAVADLVSILGPTSAAAQILKHKRVVKLAFDRRKSVLVPTIMASAAGIKFIAEGSPLPVVQMVTSGPILDPKKVAVIVALTNELFESSNAEALIRAAMAEATALGIDTILFDNVAADTVRPAGLRNGVAAITATAGTTTDAMFEDLGSLATAVAAVAGNQNNIAFIASPEQAVKISLRTNDTFGFEVYSSAALASGTVIAVALNALAVIVDPAPRFSVSNDTTLHFEDTTPLPISTPGTPNTVAAPVRSMWQQHCMAIRLLFDANWVLRAPGAVAWTSGVTW